MSMSSYTCTHSSRVGTTMSALTPCAGSSPSRWTTGMPKPKVLPVPVLACPMMSWPGRPRGMVCSWIGNASTMPLAARVSTMSWSTPSSAKVVTMKACLAAR